MKGVLASAGLARRRRRSLALLFFLLALSWMAVGAGQAQAASITSSGPLTRVEISPDLNCAVSHVSDSAPEFFGDTACGTLLASGGTLFGPLNIPAGGAAAPRTPFTAVSQSAVTGTGTAADPFQIVTVVDLGTTGLRITETDTYVIGDESYRTDVQVSNSGSSSQDAILYRAGDCFLQSSDFGYGSVDAATGAVACTTGLAPGSRIEQWFPISPGSHYYEAFYSEVWARIGSQQPFPDTCRCTELIDNGAGLSWNITIPAGGSVTRSHLTTFSPLGRLPLSTSKTADAASSVAGGSNGYTISISNPNPNAVTLDSITDTLPPGFTYAPGSTTGATTTDPSISGQALTWSGPISVPGASGGNPGTVSLHFNVTASFTPGDFFNNAGATSTDFTVAPTGDTAPITVTQPQQADLSVTKSDSPDPVSVGGNLTYTLTVQNSGPQNATGVTVTDTLPTGVVFGSVTASQGSCTQAAGMVTCALGDLANGASASIDIAVSAPPSAGTITNSASVSGTQSDPDTVNNSASEDTTVQAAQPGPGIPCEIDGKGKITADNGDRASFKIDVESGATPSGRLRYRDHGPAAPFKLKSTAIDQVAVSADGSEATIEGTATIHGGGSVGFTVIVKDLPKAPDTFRIQLSNGYDSGEQTITRGDVDIECECEVEGDGKITDAFDSQAKFKVEAEAIPPVGKVRYWVEGSRLKSTEITGLTVSGDEREASIQGQATIDGEGPFDFTVDVRDVRHAPDTFRIQLSNGYDSGEQAISRGDVDIECDGRCHKRGHSE